MSVNLSKGSSVSLDKARYALHQVTIGCGWDVAKPGLVGRLMGASDQDFDLDIIAIALQHGRLVNTGDDRLHGSDVCFYNNPSVAGCIGISDDDRTGSSSDGGDDESIYLSLAQLDPVYDRIVFLVQIYQGSERNQDFSRIQNAYVRAVDAKGREMARYSLSGAGTARSVVFAELRRAPGGWDFKAIGETSRADSFTAYLSDFVAGRR